MSLLGAHSAHAQASEWPTKPLKLVVPFPPGGTSDFMGRLIAGKLAVALKQPVNVENIAGGGGVTGTLKALSQPADGYTLIQSGIGQNAVAHGMDAQVGYDSIKDFTHLTQVHSGANVLVASPKSPFKTLAELIAYGKANPGKLSYGFTHASSGHVAMELLKQSLSVCLGNAQGGRDCKGLSIVGVPYKGGGPLVAALLEGQVPMAFINQDSAYPLVKEGKLQALAVTSTSRNSLFPNVPAISEKEIPGFVAMSWSGISVSSKTPAPIAARLEAELVKIMQSPDTRQQLESKGFVIPDQGSHSYANFVDREVSRWGRVIRIAGIKPE
ncbi:Bug family tripartite tricarboxylate transporter substrate binding protein [Ideonella azotifigens]|uniref:Tripartite tricarboxylate transporter substrate binding protein n=2 Tax=Ideonella azotifigens TaxID=513160 RepID=A0ABN1KC79_9BURK|nr:tripartite tricarboxylate transporter substrate binding protein [Ideonella azotifigens]